ncbi:chloride channel protein [Cutibacterium sp. WCA-380-WT-3A]|uniref:Chloride channel protein n=1 Tax=Cutibacterium porci TaxID=2605781 RepID=A0A7K0J4A9_9ACTN|nr:chloride channel protein [Cutibacterium porci]MSS44753.1 chloride channel protein [Cutibacterium porci]
MVSSRLRCIAAVVLTGVASGLIGGVTSLLSHLIETCAFGTPFSSSTTGVGKVVMWRRFAAPIVGAVIAGLTWWRLRPRPSGSITSVREAVDSGTRLRPAQTIVDALAQLVVVGSGSSLGREAAPRQMAALAAQGLSDSFRIDTATRRALLASAAGAGLASVYNVPIAGALYALELTVRPNLRTKRGWGQVGVAVVISVLSTVTAWLFNHNRPIYRSPVATVTATGLCWVLVVVAASTLVGAGMGVLFGEMKRRVPVTSRLWWTVPVGSLGVTVVALAVPEVVGNGQVIVNLVLAHPVAPSCLAILLVGKIGATTIALRSGAAGGLLTPSLSAGALVGALIAAAAGIDAPSQVAMMVIVGAGCVLSVTQRAPLFAAVFALELTQAGVVGVPVVLAAVVLGWAGFVMVSRRGRGTHGRIGRAPGNASDSR